MFGRSQVIKYFSLWESVRCWGPGGRLLQHISPGASPGIIISSAPGTPVSPRGLCAQPAQGSCTVLLPGGGGGRREEPALCTTAGRAGAVAAGGGGRGEKRKDAPCGERKKSGSRQSSRTGSCSAHSLPRSGRPSWAPGLPPSPAGLGLRLDARLQVSYIGSWTEKSQPELCNWRVCSAPWARLAFKFLPKSRTDRRISAVATMAGDGRMGSGWCEPHCKDPWIQMEFSRSDWVLGKFPKCTPGICVYI